MPRVHQHYLNCVYQKEKLGLKLGLIEGNGGCFKGNALNEECPCSPLNSLQK